MTSVASAFDKLPVFEHDHDMPGASPKGPLGAHGIRAFRHRASAVRVILFNVPGPLVSATIVVGTEPVSNAGHPHTLEHIIFLGSHNHPQRGYLDNLACRSISDGTNAWTDNEFTAYTATTVGIQGFVNLLPCYLDHILRPNINRVAFDSEVYHIRHDGKEAGVVFCEMQARENTEADLSDTAMHSILFEGTPLSLNSGGLCEHIRTLTNDDIVRFHTDQYCGANISIVVGGSNILSADLLSSIQPLLDNISSAPNFSPGVPRWRNSLLLHPLPPVTHKVLPFPSNDQSIGTVILGWRGPGSSQREESFAIDTVLRYLASNVWSPLRQRLVEVDDQLASDITVHQETFYATGSYMISFEGVEHHGDNSDGDSDSGANDNDDDDNVDDHHEKEEDKENDTGKELANGGELKKDDSFLLSRKFESAVMDFLKSICESGDLPGGLSAIHVAIKKQREEMLSELESAPHTAVPYSLVEELVYDGQDGLVIGQEVRGYFAQCDVLMQKDEKFWLSFIEHKFVQAPRVELVMVPDEDLAEKLAEMERKGVDERVDLLGKESLAKLGKENEDRIASLKAVKFKAESFPSIPSTSNISRFPYTVSRQRHGQFIAQSVALETEFVHCTISLDTKTLTMEQRMWLPILCNLISTSDIILDDGSCIKYTDNSRAISEATMGDRYGTQLGYGNGMAHQCVIVRFTALPESFEEAAGLILRMVFQSEMTVGRIAAVSQTMMADCTADMRDAETMLAVALALVPFMVVDWDVDLPNFVVGSFTGIMPTLALLSEELPNKKGMKVVKRRVLEGMQGCLESLRGQLSCSDVMVEVAARDPEVALKAVERLWTEKACKLGQNGQNAMESVNGLGRDETSAHELPISRRLQGRLGDLLKGRGTVGKVIGIGGVDTSFIEARVDTDVHVGHSDWGALSVLLEMLCRIEGPLSDAVRVSGLAYGADIAVSEWRGQLDLLIYESSSVTAAWESVCRTLEAFRLGLDAIDEANNDVAVDLDTAKASMLYNMTDSRSSAERIVGVVRCHSAMGVPASAGADQALEEEIMKVTVDDLRRVFDTHVRNVYDGRERCERLVVVTCGGTKVKETAEAFAKSEWPLQLERCVAEDLVPKQVRSFVNSLKS